MKLFYLLALEGISAQKKPSSKGRPSYKDECDRAHLPDVEHARWGCYYDGEIDESATHPSECYIHCLDGFEIAPHPKAIKDTAKCTYNKKKEDYEWSPRVDKPDKYAHCQKIIADDCSTVPSGTDLAFYLLLEDIAGDEDSYSNDEGYNNAIVGGTIPIPADIEPTSAWTVMIDFGTADISNIDFDAVNAAVIGTFDSKLLLRNRDFLPNIKDIGDISLIGSHEGSQELPLISAVKFFPEHYWNYECVTFSKAAEVPYCDALRAKDQAEPTPALAAKISAICGEPVIVEVPVEEEGSGESPVVTSGDDTSVSM